MKCNNRDIYNSIKVLFLLAITKYIYTGLTVSLFERQRESEVKAVVNNMKLNLSTGAVQIIISQNVTFCHF